MKEFSEGTVVIVGTGQSGTLLGLVGNKACVLLQNGDIWVGFIGTIRIPQSQEDLDSAILDVDRFLGR